MKKPKRLTNEQFVASLMSSGKVGLMCQLVVLTALDNYTRSVVTLPPAALKKAFPENGMIHGGSWQRACQEIQDKLAARCAY